MAGVPNQAVAFDKSTLTACRRPAPMKRAPRLRFDADVVVHGSANPALAAEIAFSCLHGNVAEKELDLIQFSTRCMAQLLADGVVGIRTVSAFAVGASVLQPCPTRAQT